MVFILFGGTRFYVTTMGNLWNGNIDGIYTFASANGFSRVCIFSWRFWLFRLTKISSHILQAFLLCVSLLDISEFFIAHPAGWGLFSCYVYLLVTFQNVLWHILQEKGFSAMCTFAKYFKMSNCNSCRHRAFILCVSSHDVSKCLVAHPASIELFSSIIWLEVPKQFGNFITLYISNVFNCVWSLSRNVFQTTGQLNSFKQLFFCFYLLMILQNVSSHILQAKGFYPVCIFAWNFWLFRLTKVSFRGVR